MRWQQIEVNGKNKDMPDILDIFDCQREQSKKHCKGCPYTKKCLKIWRKSVELGNKMMNNLINEDREIEGIKIGLDLELGCALASADGEIQRKTGKTTEQLIKEYKKNKGNK